jgi:hypothetical protein
LRLADITSKSTLIFNPSCAPLIFAFFDLFARSASGKSYIDHYLVIMSLSRTPWAKVEMRWSGREWQDIDERIGLSFSSCHYGGKRPWFVCPMAECGRTVAVLYRSGLRFLCRHCHSLAYASQRAGRAERALRRGQKIRTRLGGSPFVIDPFPAKPKRMRWATYGRLLEQANEAELERLKALGYSTTESKSPGQGSAPK